MPIDRVLLSIHGVETEGEWQEEIDRSFKGIAGLAHDRYKYGKFHFWKATYSAARDSEILAFTKKWDEVYRDTGVVPSVIAHSFGTYIAFRALLRYPAMAFNHVILCGSILDCDFDWPSMISNGRVQAVLNETAGDDWVVAMFRSAVTRAVITGSGPSGLDGFNRSTPALQQPHYADLSHSGAFVLRAHCDAFWRPFIFGNVPFAALCRRAQHEVAERQKLREECMPIIHADLQHFFGQTAGSPYAEVLAKMVFENVLKYGAEGVLTAKQLIFAVVSGLWQKSE